MNTKLIISSLIGTSTIGGLATGGYYLLKSKAPEKTKTLLQVLLIEGFEKLDTDPESTKDNTEWINLITKHLKTDYTKVPKINNIVITTATDNTANIKAFKAECKKILSKTSDFQNDKENAKNWCNKKSKVLTEDS